MTLILHKYNATTATPPDPSEIVPRELAINTADGKLFTKKDDGTVVEIGAGGGGGVTDHGALTGLGDDDHTQYHNDARGDARYSQLGHTHALTDLTQSGATDGQVATWNNSSSQWEPQTPSGGGGGSGPAVPFIIPAATEYVASMAMSATYTTMAQTANRMYLNPFIPSQTFTCGALGIWCTTSASSSNSRVCVYASGTDGKPTGSALVSTTNLATTSTGLKEDTGATYTFTAGTQYWLGVHSSSTQTLRAFSSASTWELLAIPSSTTGVVGFYMTATYASGAPTIGTLTNNTGNSPFAFIKGS